MFFLTYRYFTFVSGEALHEGNVVLKSQICRVIDWRMRRNRDDSSRPVTALFLCKRAKRHLWFLLDIDIHSCGQVM